MARAHRWISTGVLIVLAPTTAHAQIGTPYDKCGTYIQGQLPSCVLFHPDDGSQNVWHGAPPAPYTVGSHVRLQGTYILCPSPCMAPCVTNPVVTNCPGPCRADFDGNGTLSVQDIFAFLSAWFDEGAGADYDGDGTIAVADIFAYLNAWFTGC